jgi:uncharacterized metal-binding protein YceD (DUF177 family)
MSRHIKPEWSFLVEVEKLGPTPATYTITPDAEARAALCDRLGLLDLQNVQATLHLGRERGGHVIHITGTVAAAVVQECVATLRPVPSQVTGEIDTYYAEASAPVSFEGARAKLRAKAGEGEQEIVDEVDAPEPIIDGQIDLGEIATQFLSLALPDYPRAADAPEIALETGQPLERKDSPFAALQQWKDGLK